MASRSSRNEFWMPASGLLISCATRAASRPIVVSVSTSRSSFSARRRAVTSRPSASSWTTPPSASRIGFREKSRIIRCPPPFSISTSCLTISPSRAAPHAIRIRSASSGVGHQPPPPEIEQPLELVSAVEDGAEPPLAVLPLLVHAAPLAHVPAHPEQQHGGAVGPALRPVPAAHSPV